MALKARFIPRNPGKYMGNPNNIFCRSSWELVVCKFFDTHPSIYKWSSEEIRIPYIKPTDGKVHHYFPDFLVVYKDKDGNMLKELIEVKPLKETVLTEKSSNYDKMNILINRAKWDAAEAFCAQHGMTFRVLTEASLFAGGAPKGRTRPTKPNNKPKRNKVNNKSRPTTPTKRKTS